MANRLLNCHKLLSPPSTPTTSHPANRQFGRISRRDGEADSADDVVEVIVAEGRVEEGKQAMQ